MDETEFWEIIDRTREAADGDPEEHADLLTDRLAQLDPESVVDFARHFENRFNRANQWDLWAAAYLMLGGAGEEAFDSFRCWLIGQGRHVFEGALDTPDDLARLVRRFDDDTDGDGEDLGFAADEAYERLTGGQLPDLGIPEPAPEPEGDFVDLEDDQLLAERFPRLWARFS